MSSTRRKQPRLLFRRIFNGKQLFLLSSIIGPIMTFYRLSLLIDIFISISDVVTAICLFLLKYYYYYTTTTRSSNNCRNV